MRSVGSSLFCPSRMSTQAKFMVSDHELPWTTMNYHGQPWSYDHELPWSTMFCWMTPWLLTVVLDYGQLWSWTMVDWSLTVSDHGHSQSQTMVSLWCHLTKPSQCPWTTVNLWITTSQIATTSKQWQICLRKTYFLFELPTRSNLHVQWPATRLEWV